MISCDRCGPNVRAAKIIIVDTGTLAFCKHHFDQHGVAITLREYEVIDIEDMASPVPKVSDEPRPS